MCVVRNEVGKHCGSDSLNGYLTWVHVRRSWRAILKIGMLGLARTRINGVVIHQVLDYIWSAIAEYV